MNLPDFPPISQEALAAIAATHGATSVTPMPEVGIFNALYALGDALVLRIPRDHPAFIGAAAKEAQVVPLVRAAGLSTPALVAFDDSRTHLGVPYTVYERVHGVTLGLDNQTAGPPKVWREVGRELARLHAAIPKEGTLARLEKETLPPPQDVLAALVDDGYLTALESSWLGALVARLEVAVRAYTGSRFLHGDMQLTNLMVDTQDAYLCLLDWGASGWGDPAEDFAGLPLRVVPAMLEGYRELTPLDDDDTAEARILYRHLQIALFLLSRPPLPQRSWAERPLGMMLETLHCLTTDPVWRRFAL